MERWCSKFDKECVDWLNMVLSKEWNKTITDARWMIRECLNCKIFKSVRWCDDAQGMIDLLDENKSLQSNKI